ncbi:MAG: hypothetical protein AAF748_16360 [Pseudomonadota bacterium]
MSSLEPREKIGLELDRLNWLWQRYGPDKGELELVTAMEDMASLLHEISISWDVQDTKALRMRALAIQSVADRLGMPLVSRVSGDVIALCGTCDRAALAATVARLERAGEQSLIAIWDAQAPS